MAETKDEQIGFHKGSLQTLFNERNELAKMVQIVEQLMQMHVNELKKLGVDLEAQAKKAAAKASKKAPGKSLDEDLL